MNSIDRTCPARIDLAREADFSIGVLPVRPSRREIEVEGVSQVLQRGSMALAAKLGLVDCWRATGKWPDFCAGPGLPYDCRAEAARLAFPSGPANGREAGSR